MHRDILKYYLYEALKMKTRLFTSHLHAPTSTKAEGAYVVIEIWPLSGSWHACSSERTWEGPRKLFRNHLHL